MQKLTLKNADRAIEAMATYYQNCNMYLQSSNSRNAKDYYIREIGPLLKELIPYGMSYVRKDSYLIAIDATELRESNHDLYCRVFGGAEYNYKYLDMDKSEKIIFICCIGNCSEHLDTNSYRLIEEFINKYKRNYVIYTDAPNDYDQPVFAANTRFTELRSNDVMVWRYNST